MRRRCHTAIIDLWPHYHSDPQNGRLWKRLPVSLPKTKPSATRLWTASGALDRIPALSRIEAKCAVSRLGDGIAARHPDSQPPKSRSARLITASTPSAPPRSCGGLTSPKGKSRFKLEFATTRPQREATRDQPGCRQAAPHTLSLLSLSHVPFVGLVASGPHGEPLTSM